MTGPLTPAWPQPGSHEKTILNEPEYIDPAKLRPGPIRNKSLPPELLDGIKVVFEVIGRYFDMTLEQFEIGFMRDKHPEKEVAVWCSIAGVAELPRAVFERREAPG